MTNNHNLVILIREHVLFSGTCKVDQFDCGNGQCIPNRWRCDGSADCSNDSDEKGCPTKPPTEPTEPTEPSEDQKIPCADDEWRCKSGDQCIDNEWKCDDEADCKDGSDEKDCGVCDITYDFHLIES